MLDKFHVLHAQLRALEERIHQQHGGGMDWLRKAVVLPYNIQDHASLGFFFMIFFFYQSYHVISSTGVAKNEADSPSRRGRRKTAAHFTSYDIRP